LGAFQRALVSELSVLGLAPDHESFVPHITLARARSPRGDPALCSSAGQLRDADFGDLAVREVALFSSQTDRHGMRYSPVVTHALKGI
jgi:2'-5' RNA ligase